MAPIDRGCLEHLAKLIHAARTVRFASGWRPVVGDYGKSWLQSIEAICDDTDTVHLLHVLLQAHTGGERNHYNPHADPRAVEWARSIVKD